MTTELIASTKSVTTKRGDMVIVRTALGAEIWVPKAQFDNHADQVVYESHKKGDKYIDREGTEQTYNEDGNKFVGMKKLNKFELLEFMAKIGVSPSLS